MAFRVHRAFTATLALVATTVLAGSLAANKRDATGALVKKHRADESSHHLTPQPKAAKPLNVPLSFEPNEGQTDKQVRFLARTERYTVFLTGSEAVFSLPGRKADNVSEGDRTTGAGSFAMGFAGGNLHPDIYGADVLTGHTNYLIGNDPAAWKTNIPNYAKVQYRNVLPGVDVLYYGNDHRLEYDLEVSPGFSASQIALNLEGVNKLHVSEDGEVHFSCAGNNLSFGKPRIYQVSLSGKMESVKGSWVARKNGQLGFQIGAYDHSKSLIIDPTLNFGLTGFPFATYLGGSAEDTGNAIAVDPSGAIYVTGLTTSSNFPTTPGALKPSDPSTGTNAFVTKFQAGGLAVAYSTYLGGNSDVDPSGTLPPTSIGNGIAVNNNGNAFVVGYTTAHGSFPTTPAGETGCATPPTPTTCDNVFLTELSAGGDTQVYGHFIDGNSGNAVALDSTGNAYVTGTSYGGLSFPNSLQPIFGGPSTGTDAFVTKVDTTGAQVWWTYLGGGGNDSGTGIALDSSGNVYVTGQTFSTNFPTVNPVQPAYGGGGDAFVAEINNAGTAFVYSTFLGGSAADGGSAIAVDSEGDTFVTGQTSSSDFPIASPLQPAYGGGGDAFVTKLTPGGADFAYSTYLGGAAAESGRGIAVDSQGNVYVSGSIASPASPSGSIGLIDANLLNLPTNSIQPQCADTGGCSPGDAFITSLNPSGTGFLYFTYLGGGSADYATSIALDTSANCSQASPLPPPFGVPCVYVTGNTASADFPVSANAPYATQPGLSNAFVALAPSIIAPVCTPTFNQVGFTVTVTLMCTANFSGGQGLVNFGGVSTATIGLGGIGQTVSQSFTFTTAGKYSISESMTNTAGVVPTSYAIVFPVQNLGPVMVTIAGNCGATNPTCASALQPPTTAQFTATVQNASNTSVTWYVNDVQGGTAATGTISPGGLYTPPSPPFSSETPVTIYAIANADGMTQSSPFSLGVNPPTSSIASLSATSGPVGTAVTITGTNFGATQGTSTVTFNGTTATVTSWSATSIATSVPAGATTGNVVVTIDGVASNGVNFTVIPTPSIASLSATSGPVGTAVTITGTNFGATQGTSTVTFNGTTATVTSWSATSIATSVPAGATTGNVVVKVGGVASNGVNFTVAASTTPIIASLSATSGPVGTAVTITGTNFGATQGTSTVTFNGTTATVTSWSATSIATSVPAGATTGNVVVKVGGVASNGVNFTVAASTTPIIASLSATSGPVGTAVTITGTNFGATQGTSTVTFNGTTATVTSWSATSIATSVPAGATTGNVVVKVSGAASNGVNFTVIPTPSIASLSATSGPVGTAVTITGTNFGATQGTSTVTFNGTTATVTSWSATSIATSVPAGATTGNVVVKVGGVASNGVNFTVSAPVSISIISPIANFSIDVGGNPVAIIANVTGSPNAQITWKLSGTGCSGTPCGSISTLGPATSTTYTPPGKLTAAQTDTITATAQADPTKSASIEAIVFLPSTAPPPAVATVTAGQPAQYSLTLTPGTGDPLYPLTLSCANLPNGTNCVFSQNPLPVGTSTFGVTVTTSSSTASSVRGGFLPPGLFAALPSLVSLLLLAFGGRELRQKNLKLVRVSLLCSLCILLTTSVVACGTGGSFGNNQLPSPSATPSGKFMIVVNGQPKVGNGDVQPAQLPVTTLPLDVN